MPRPLTYISAKTLGFKTMHNFVVSTDLNLRNKLPTHSFNMKELQDKNKLNVHKKKKTDIRKNLSYPIADNCNNLKGGLKKS